MKRIQLIEIGILMVALIFGFKAIESLFSVMIFFLYQTTGDGGSGGWSFIFRYLIVAIIYFAAFLLLVKKTKWLAFVTIVLLVYANSLAEWFTRFSKSGDNVIETNPGSAS